MTTKENNRSSSSGIPNYDETHFQVYISLLKTACLNSESEDPLSGEDNPIHNFVEEKSALKAYLQTENIPFTQEDLRKDPLKNGRHCMAAIKAKYATSQARQKEYKELLKEWKKWKSGEMFIYNTASKSLTNQGWILSGTGIPFGAGLHFVRPLASYRPIASGLDVVQVLR